MHDVVVHLDVKRHVGHVVRVHPPPRRRSLQKHVGARQKLGVDARCKVLLQQRAAAQVAQRGGGRIVVEARGANLLVAVKDDDGAKAGGELQVGVHGQQQAGEGEHAGGWVAAQVAVYALVLLGAAVELIAADGAATGA